MGEFDEAGKIFLGAADSATTNPGIKPASIAKAYGNLGLTYEYTEKYALAIEALKKAYMLAPDQKYLNEQAAVGRRQAEAEELKRQGVVK
jgi:tetratricopeptide (TPR) repeat protein